MRFEPSGMKVGTDSMHPALQQIKHRPWPLPETPWVWRQAWCRLAFIHWEVEANLLRQQLPQGLELDLHDGKAWVGIVPFEMIGVTLRGVPPLVPWLCDFPEINVRTYVKWNGRPGVWFLSLDATQPLAVLAAQTLFHLPYHKARIRVQAEPDHIQYRAQRGTRVFDATYRPGPAVQAEPDSFETWATERYCLYAADSRGRLCSSDVHHIRWPLQSAEIQIHENSLCPLPLGRQHPAILYSERIDVVLWPLRRIPE